MERVDDIPASEFDNIISELRSLFTKDTKPQTFGIVTRRSQLPDYSKLCAARPLLYKYILEFGEKYVKIPFTSITVNQNNSKRRNATAVFIVSFGNFTGGELEVLDGEYAGVYDIKYKPVITTFKYAIKEHKGERYSLTFYQSKKATGIPSASVVLHDGRYLFKRGDDIVYNTPCKKYLSGVIRKESREVVHSFW